MTRFHSLNEIEDALHKIEDQPVRDASLIPELLSLHARISRVQEDPETAYEMLEAIVRGIGEAAIPPLLRATRSKKARERAAALDMLRMVGRPGDTEIITSAERLLSDRSPVVRQTAIQTLAEVADERATNALIKTLDSDPFQSIFAVGALGRIGGTRAVEVLGQLLYQDDHIGRTNYVIEALVLIGTPEAFAEIRNWKRSTHGKAYIEEQAEYQLEAFRAGPPSYWERFSLITTEEASQHEVLRLQQEITMLALSKALRDPALSDHVEAALRRIRTAEADRILGAQKSEKG